MQWLDCSSHNAALWVGRRVPASVNRVHLLPIDPNAPITGVDEQYLERLLGEPQAPSVDALFDASSTPSQDRDTGAAAALNPNIERDARGAIVAIAFDHPDENDPRGRLSVSQWMRLAPQSLPRDTASMLIDMPPSIDKRDEQLGAQWLWSVPTDSMAEADLEALGVEAIPGAQIVTLDEPSAQRLVISPEPLQTPPAASTLNTVPGVSTLLLTDAPIAKAKHAARQGEEKRDDYGEKIGGARKDLAARSGIDAERWAKSLSSENASVSRTDDGASLVLSFNNESMVEARNAARRLKRDQLWKARTPEQAAEAGQSALGYWRERWTQARLPANTSAMEPTRPSRPLSPVSWLVLAGGYGEMIRIGRERAEAPASDEAVIQVARDELNAYEQMAKARDIREESQDFFYQNRSSFGSLSQLMEAKDGIAQIIQRDYPGFAGEAFPTDFYKQSVEMVRQKTGGQSRRFIEGDARISNTETAHETPIEADGPDIDTLNEQIASRVEAAAQKFAETTFPAIGRMYVDNTSRPEYTLALLRDTGYLEENEAIAIFPSTDAERERRKSEKHAETARRYTNALRHQLDSLAAGTETDLRHSRGLGLWQLRWGTDALGGDLSFETEDGTTVNITLADLTDQTETAPE